MRNVLFAAVVGFASLAAAPALAGQCPPDKVMTDATRPNATPANGVTDTVLAAIDLAQEPSKIDGRMLRMRRLTIAPGGVVPGIATAIGRPLFMWSPGRSPNTPATAPSRSSTRAAKSRARPMSPRIGGRTLRKTARASLRRSATRRERSQHVSVALAGLAALSQRRAAWAPALHRRTRVHPA